MFVIIGVIKVCPGRCDDFLNVIIDIVSKGCFPISGVGTGNDFTIAVISIARPEFFFIHGQTVKIYGIGIVIKYIAGNNRVVILFRNNDAV